MPGGAGRTRWHFKVLTGGVKGIAVVRNKAELVNKSEKPLGAIGRISTPKSRKSCAEATSQGFLDYAIQVS